MHAIGLKRAHHVRCKKTPWETPEINTGISLALDIDRYLYSELAGAMGPRERRKSVEGIEMAETGRGTPNKAAIHFGEPRKYC